MNSFNHYWLGCVGEWLQCSVAGLDTEGPGFARIKIRPAIASPGKGLTAARGSYESIRGRITSGWQTDDKAFNLKVTIPANTTATVYVPSSSPDKVTESGVAANQAKGVKFLRQDPGYAVYAVGSGTYKFTSQ